MQVYTPDHQHLCMHTQEKWFAISKRRGGGGGAKFGIILPREIPWLWVRSFWGYLNCLYSSCVWCDSFMRFHNAFICVAGLNCMRDVVCPYVCAHTRTFRWMWAANKCVCVCESGDPSIYMGCDKVLIHVRARTRTHTYEQTHTHTITNTYVHIRTNADFLVDSGLPPSAPAPSVQNGSGSGNW